MAPLFPPWHPSFRPRVLLVLPLLPFPFPPHFPHLLLRPPWPPPLLLSPLQPLHSYLHVLPLARILSIFSSSCHSHCHLCLLFCLWLQILDCHWFALCLFPLCGHLSDCSSQL
ncbi:hypothetical protein ACSBR1_033324 [Camellia fascicularis]